MSFVTISHARNKAFVQNVLSPDTAESAARDAEIARHVRQEVAKLRDAAEAEARAAGETAARAALAPLEAALGSAIAAFGVAAAQLMAPLAQKERELAELAVELGFLLARHIGLGGLARHSGPGGLAGNISPAGDAGADGLHGLVTKRLDEAAAERGARQMLRLRLNPADHRLIAGTIPPGAAQLLADETITAGGAMVEIVTPDGDPVDKVEWDATLQGRLETMRAALGLAAEGA